MIKKWAFLYLLFILIPLEINRYDMPINISVDISLTKHNLWREICKYPFQDCVLVMKSAIAECGHKFDSYNAKHRNNLFGMRCSKRVDKCSNNYSHYMFWQESVRDRYVHEQRNYKGGSYRRYIDKHWGIMDGKYTRYLDKIKFKAYGI